VLSYLIAGLAVGAVYAISAMALVITYNASRVFNFAQGGMAFFVAYCFYWLVNDVGLNSYLAAAISVFVIAPLLGLVLWAVLLGKLSSATPLARLAAMIGLSVALTAGTSVLFGHETIVQPKGIIQDSGQALKLGGVSVSDEQLLILVVAALIAGIGYLVLNKTAAGLVTRGAVDSQMMTVLTGTNPGKVVAGTWMVGTSIAGLAGILIMPSVGLSAIGFANVVAASFAGVVIGRLTNLWWGFFGALAVGVAQSVVIPYLPDEGLLATALRPSMPFIFMLIAILVQIRSAGVRDDIQSREVARLSTKAEANEAHVHAVMRDPRGSWDRWVGWAVLVVVLFLVPIVFEQFWVGVIALGMAYAIALLSIRPVTGETNVVSLCQISFVGIGAIAAAQLSTTYGWDVTTSLIIGAVVAALCGLVVGVVCLPLGQLYAAITTFAFALLAEQVIYTRPTFSNNDSGVFLDRPTIAGVYLLDNTQFFFFATAVFFIVAGVLALLRRSTAGLALATIRSSRVRASTLGIPIYRSRLALFALGAAIAGLAGGIIASYQYVAFPAGYSAALGLTWFAIAVAQGPSSIGGLAAAGLSLSIAPALFGTFLPTRLADIPAVLFGLMAIQIVANPAGINPQLRSAFRLLARKLTPQHPPGPPSDDEGVRADVSTTAPVPVGSLR
jgi:branched-chain amino acid transport system permease protein